MNQSTHCILTDLNGETVLIPWGLLAACIVQRITNPDCTVIMDHRAFSARVRESVSDIAAALRALARPDVGLPAGWTDGEDGGKCKGGETLYTAYGPSGCYARLEIWPDGVATWSQFRAPPAVYLHLLRAAGVSNG